MLLCQGAELFYINKCDTNCLRKISYCSLKCSKSSHFKLLVADYQTRLFFIRKGYQKAPVICGNLHGIKVKGSRMQQQCTLGQTLQISVDNIMLNVIIAFEKHKTQGFWSRSE